MAKGKVQQTVGRNISKPRSWVHFRFFITAAFFSLVILGARLENITISTSFIGVGEWGIACPLGVAQVLVATGKVLPSLILAGLGGVVLIALMGRAFCGWICPARWIFNRSPASGGKPWRYRNWIQRMFVGGVVGVAYVCHNSVFCTICPAGVICRGAIAAGTGGSILPAVGWLGALVAVEWTTGRSWCRDLCPLGAAGSQLSRLNHFFKPKPNPEICRPCVACQRVCSENLNLARDTDLSTCTKCFACQTSCPRGAVEIKWIA